MQLPLFIKLGQITSRQLYRDIFFFALLFSFTAGHKVNANVANFSFYDYKKYTNI